MIQLEGLCPPNSGNELNPTQQRFLQEKKRLADIELYLKFKEYPQGISDNQKRVIRGQAQTHSINENGELYMKRSGIPRKIVLEFEEAQEILQKYHLDPLTGGHSGWNNTLSKISLYYFWKGMKEDVQNYVLCCPKCQHFTKIKTQAPLLQSIKVTRVFELVGMDLIGPFKESKNGNKYCITFTDYYSKFVVVSPLQSKAATGVASSIRDLIRRYGPPERLLSDQGREFVNEVNKAVMAEFNIRHSITAAYHPQTNGLDERTNQTIKSRLSKFINEKQDDWDLYVEDIAYSINLNKQTSTKFSPFFLMFGRHPNQIEKMQIEEKSCYEVPSEEEFKDIVNRNMEESKNIHEIVDKNVATAQQKQKEDYFKKNSKGVVTFDLKVGLKVLKKNNKNKNRQGGKLDKAWDGPYTISSIRNQKIELQDEKIKLKTKVSWDQIKPYKESDFHIKQKGLQEIQEPIIHVEDESITEEKRKHMLESDKENQIERFKDLADSNAWLSDREIDWWMSLLKDMSNVDGLLSCLLFGHYSLIEQCKREFIQIVNITGDHWTTLSNINFQTDSITHMVHVYDSLYNDYSPEHVLKMAGFAASLLRPSNDVIILRIHNIHKQIGSADCGYFAIGIATLLSNHIDPRLIKFNQSLIRKHVYNCAKNNKINNFPCFAQASLGGYVDHVINIHCHCRLPILQGIKMFTCIFCQKSYHENCIPPLLTAAGNVICINLKIKKITTRIIVYRYFTQF